MTQFQKDFPEFNKQQQHKKISAHTFKNVLQQSPSTPVLTTIFDVMYYLLIE